MTANTGTETLFVSLAEQLHNSFMQIARLCELDDAQSRQTIYDVSHAAMQLTESYALSVRLQNGQATPELRPVIVSAVLRETVEELKPLAKLLGVQLSLLEPQSGSLAVTDPGILKSALTSLGQVFILAESQRGETRPVQFGVHRSRHGIVAGLYGLTDQLSHQALRRAHRLQSQASQPLQSLVSGPAAGVFVADDLLGSMSSKLHVSRYRSMNGLAVTLPKCHQLLLV